MALTQVPNSMLSTGAPSWDTSGNVGIGTSSPSKKLDVFNSGTTTTDLVVRNGTVSLLSFVDSGAGYFGLSTNHPLLITTNNTERMRIDTSGIITGTAGNLMLVQGTAQASTSGTSIDFTSIPSWVKRITVMFNGVSTNGTSNPLLQLGAGSITSSGYLCSTGGYQSTVSGSAGNYTNGFGIQSAGAANVLHGVFILSLVSGNTWAMSLSMGSSNTNIAFFGGGSVALSGTLDRVRITTVNGTDTFDAGSINIQYE